MTNANGLPSRRPTAKFDRVPPSFRRLWSLLYRATRRHAVHVDRVDVALEALTRGHEVLRDRVNTHEDALDEHDDELEAFRQRVYALEELVHGLLGHDPEGDDT